MKTNIILPILLFCLFLSCKNDILPDTPDKGNLDLSHYVAIGNSLTAGYSDGSLYLEGQLNSYPALIAKQFIAVGGNSPFLQPLLLDEAGYPDVKSVLGYRPDCLTGLSVLGPVDFQGSVNPGNNTNISSQGPFNNIGVPGIRLIDLIIPYYANFNPYSNRFMSATEKNGTFFNYALAQKPTFFTCWLGNNDVLGYASNGGTGNPSGIALGDITPVDTFKDVYNLFIEAMVSDGAKGVLITIPDVTSTPAFSTIPFNGLVIERQSLADSLNIHHAASGLHFELGNNTFVIADANAPGGKRKIKNEELIILSANDYIKCDGWGSFIPLPDNFVLDQEELKNINFATSAFNNIIKENAQKHHLALFDANAYMKTLSAGINWNGAKYDATFVSGGVFSLDAVHLTPKGYAIVANQIINSINIHYGSKIESLDLNNYRGTLYP